jgi:hypothetical protein
LFNGFDTIRDGVELLFDDSLDWEEYRSGGITSSISGKASSAALCII